MERIILHLDMDAFFASVEQVDFPELKGKPVVVGGIGERGVVATCSYEARKYGIHSAMPGFMARQKCAHAIFLPVRMKRYKEVSNRIFRLLNQYTKKIEPISIDEAFLDLSEYSEEYLLIARKIKKSIKSQTGLTVSMGVSYNKFLAKMASEWEKPNGFKVITKEMIPNILLPLPIGKIYGIGEKTVSKLNGLGVYHVEDLMKWPVAYMDNFFGKQGEEIYNLIRGIDSREIETEKEVKSIGRETTLDKDTDDMTTLLEYLKGFSVHVSYALRVKKLYAKTITVKIKTDRFAQHTKSRTIDTPIDKSKDIYKEAADLLKEMKLNEKIRLIGLTVSNISDDYYEQMRLF